ncbi:MAG: ABC transporter permease [Phycisphaerales bacterium]
MRRMLTICSRELGSYFRTPAGWIITALFLFISGVVVWLTALTPGQPASLRAYFDLCGWLLLPIAPAVTMRLIAEEMRSGTIETLLTSPVSAAELVVGKFLGACMFVGCAALPTLGYVALLYAFADPAPDRGAIAAGYASLALLAALYLAIGTLCSALTNNATLAFMMCFFALLALLFAGVAAAMDWVPEGVKPSLYALAVAPRVQDFAKGVVDLSHVTYFLGGSLICLSVAVAAVEFRRWR